MSEPASESRTPLMEGDRIVAYPCDVLVTSIGTATVHGYCSTCADPHVIDHRLYEAGGGPWLLAQSRGPNQADAS